MTKPIEILIRAKDEASSVIKSIGAAMAAYFGINAFAGAVKGAANLEAALSEVKAVSGGTADEMVRMRAAAEAAGRDTQYTATEAAIALGNLARSGLTASQSIEALPAVLQLASAGGIALEQSSTIVTRTLAGFTLAATDAGRVADVLAMGANASNTSVHGLGEALSYAAPIAKSVGLSLEGTVAVIGKFADAGIDASRAGTALNAILSQFADPASKFKTELSNLGITTGNFEKALTQLAAAGGKGEKAILAVGMEAGPALRGLLNAGIGALTELKGKLSEAGGSAEATAKIMQGNLNGSIKGLSSAWDTLKNALLTPVLPVLKNGVDSLAASFKEAVDSGVVGRFGDAISKGFEASIEWAKRFASEVDFKAFAARMQSYATRAGEAFDTIKAYATNAGNVVQTAWGVMSAGSNAVLTAIYAVGTGFAGLLSQFQQGLALIYDGMAKITFGNLSEQYKQLAADVRRSAEATYAAGYELATKSIESFNKMADGAQMARNGWDGISGSSDESAKHIDTARRVIDDTATSLKAMGGDAQAAGQKAAQASVVQRESAEKALAKVAELRAEYAKALQSGDSSKQVQALQALEHATNAATVAVRALNKENDAAKEKVGALKDAFTAFGVKTKTELKDIADISKNQFDLMKASGEATAQGLSTAFAKTAADAIAANNGIAPGWVQAQAAAQGYKLVLDELGNTTLVKLKKGTDENTSSVSGLAAAHRDGAQAANEWAQAQSTAGAAARASKLSDAELEADLSGDKYGNRAGGLPARNAALSEDYKRRKAKGQDAEGFSVDPMMGKRYEATGTSTADMLLKLQAMGYDTSDAAAQQAAASVAKLVTDSLNNFMGVGFSGQGLAKTPEQLLQEAMAGAYRAVASTPSAGDGSAQPTSSRPAAVAAKTYNVTIKGTTIKTNSDDDAKNLIRVLRDARLSS